ncbi:MAG: hypothetical protein ABJ056_10500 [Halioglobus sp.]
MNRSRITQKILVLSFWLACAHPLVLAQDGSAACDPSIRQNLDHPQGYKGRGAGLCEGVYATGVSSLGISLASLSGPLAGIDLGQAKSYSIAWKTASSNDVRIRADSLRPRFYYRMDAVRPGSDGRMVWQNDIPAHNQLHTREIGILARQKNASGEEVYLPLQISSDGHSAPLLPYQATVISGADIEEVYWSLSQNGQSLVFEQAVNLSPYMAHQPISIQLDQVNEPGSYHVIITAVLRNGMTNSFEFVFLHER